MRRSLSHSRVVIGSFVKVVLLTALLGALPVAVWADGPLMTIPGKFDVTPSGTASYKIPIAIPPGSAGMVPSLALEYSSVGGNGIVGVGWSLSGVASVDRCPQTMAQDGKRGGVTYSLNDRFCLDGQRLIMISGAFYGADGSEYRTELDSFNRILAHGSTGPGGGTGPAWFEVHTKSGQTMEFGNTTDSQVLAAGTTSVRSWALDRVTDTVSNYFTIKYLPNNSNGQSYPLEIDYTGNSGTSQLPYNSVKFTYNTARADVTPMYQAGSIVLLTALLTDIQTYAGSNLVLHYALSYQPSIQTRRSHLSGVSICGADGTTCLPNTTFAWSDGEGVASTYAHQAGSPMGGNTTTVRTMSADFNGDGRADLLVCRNVVNHRCYGGTDADGYKTQAWISQIPSTPNFVQEQAPLPDTTNGYLPFLGDVNADGRTDLVVCNADADGRCKSSTLLSWYFANPDGSFPGSPTGQKTTPNFDAVLTPADFDGDGRIDVMFCEADTDARCKASNPVQVWTTTTTPFDTVQSYTSPGQATIVLVGDFNGDGKADLFWCQADIYGRCKASTTYYIWLSQLSGGLNASSPITGTTPPFDANPQIADFNGDGLADIFWCAGDEIGSCNTGGTSNVAIWIGDGTGHFPQVDVFTMPAPGWIRAVATLGDFNGDGRTDILWCNANQYNVCYASTVLQFWYATSSPSGVIGFTVDSSSSSPSSILGPLVGNFYGRGINDIYWLKGATTGNTWQWWWQSGLSSNPNNMVPDLLTGLANGVGSNTQITFESLALKGAPYTPSTGSTYPFLDIGVSLQAVTEVDATDGIGSIYKETYAYKGAQVDLSGRGFLGFNQMTVTDPQTSIADTTTYLQPFPQTGMVAQEAKTSASYPLFNSSSQKTYVTTTSAVVGGTIYSVGLQQTLDSSMDLDGSTLPTVTTNYTYDSFGNPLTVVVTTPDGASKTTTNTYTNDTTNWFLGRLTKSTVTNTLP